MALADISLTVIVQNFQSFFYIYEGISSLVYFGCNPWYNRIFQPEFVLKNILRDFLSWFFIIFGTMFKGKKCGV